MKNLMRVFGVILVLGLVLSMGFSLSLPLNSNAIEDTTPPVLLDFTISPVVFDTSSDNVRIDFCVTAGDDISGVADVGVRADAQDSNPLYGIVGISLNFQGATSPTEICSYDIAPIGSLLGEYLIEISLIDRVGNRRVIKHPLHPCSGFNECNNAEDLCNAGFICEILNRESTNLPDADSDGIPDDADNCPDDYNDDQADADLDLIGDVCDSYPSDRDNEQAQCEADLSRVQVDLIQCEADLVECLKGDLPTCNEGTGHTCSDGIDNDRDGDVDCEDTDCSNKKNCKTKKK